MNGDPKVQQRLRPLLNVLGKLTLFLVLGITGVSKFLLGPDHGAAVPLLAQYALALIECSIAIGLWTRWERGAYRATMIFGAAAIIAHATILRNAKCGCTGSASMDRHAMALALLVFGVSCITGPKKK